MHTLPRKLLAEALGTALLLAVVIGSGIMAERLAGGNVAIALLANTLASVGGLYVLIEVCGPISGAHFNPAVSAVMALRGDLPKASLAPYVARATRWRDARGLAGARHVRPDHLAMVNQGADRHRAMDC